MRVGPLVPLLSLRFLRCIAGELGLFLGQQANENLPAGFVGLLGQRPPVVAAQTNCGEMCRLSRLANG